MKNFQIKKYILPAIIIMIVCFAIAGLAGWVTQANIVHWFNLLKKPSFNPPSWLFGPVWTVLYIMISIAGSIAWAVRQDHKILWHLFLLQLLLNFLWSFIFFGAKQLGWALFDISLLLVTVWTLIVTAWPRKRAISCWLFPYALWISFAFLLNLSLWQLN